MPTADLIPSSGLRVAAASCITLSVEARSACCIRVSGACKLGRGVRKLKGSAEWSDVPEGLESRALRESKARGLYSRSLR